MTGATDGIGEGYAAELAKMGFPLLIVSRTEAKLVKAAAALREAGAPEVRYVPCDYANAGVAEWAAVREALADLDVGFLVNNIGMSYPHAEYLHNLDDALVDKLVAINCVGTTKMTKIVLEGMAGRKKRAGVVNVGSGAATALPTDPLYSVYAGTKAYVDQLTKCLGVEYADHAIDFGLHAPLYVSTKMAQPGRRYTTWSIPSAADYARAALRRVGQDARCSPHWAHSMQWAAMGLIPERQMNNIRLKQTKLIRKKALKKKAAKQQ